MIRIVLVNTEIYLNIQETTEEKIPNQSYLQAHRSVCGKAPHALTPVIKYWCVGVIFWACM